MIPVIDLMGVNSLKKIEEAYTTVGFAVFTNALDTPDATKMKEVIRYSRNMLHDLVTYC